MFLSGVMWGTGHRLHCRYLRCEKVGGRHGPACEKALWKSDSDVVEATAVSVAEEARSLTSDDFCRSPHHGEVWQWEMLPGGHQSII